MPKTLPTLRTSLDFMPSPLEEQPGLLIRDPYQFSGSTLIIPSELVQTLTFFDGEKTENDLREYLVQLTGQVDVGGLMNHLTETLSDAGFLDDEAFQRKKQEAEAAFSLSPVRDAAMAGGGYPDDPDELTATLRGYLTGDAAAALSNPSPDANGPIGIAAPHVSPFGGIESYRAAYSALPPEYADRTFIVLGTSHYGEPDRFGLTRKPFATPLGETTPDAGLVDELAAAAGDGALMEDYCHAVEHSIEFQVIFLQHLFGPKVRVVPILCGSFGQSLFHGGLPEDRESTRRMFGALGEVAARDRTKLAWVLGVDMAHMGRRYGDRFDATGNQGEMEEVAQRDRLRIDRMEAGDARGFWELVQERQDELKWCGSAPIYTFLKAIPGARGRLLNYQHWNIDPASVVSFAGMRFGA